MKKYVEKWLKEGLISSQQAKKMFTDIDMDSSEKSSKKIIIAFSLIGAVLAGIGCILFFAANWQAIPSLVKVLSLSLITFGCAFGGYYLRYISKLYPKTGESLLFMSTLLFGSLIFLTAQIYHISSHSGLHMLIFIWMLSVLPMAYIINSRPVASLVCVQFFLWLAVFLFSNNDLDHSVRSIPVLFMVAGLFLFCFGKANEFIKGFAKTAEVFQKFAFFIIFLCMYLMTWQYFTDISNSFIYDFVYESGILPLRIIGLFLIMSAVMFLVSFFIDPAGKNNRQETYMVTGLFAFGYFLLAHSFIPRIVSNIFFAVIIMVIILAGYEKKMMFYVNLGIFWLVVFIITKYFDIFWQLLPRSLFFLAGGIILVGTALFFEHKRRKIRTELQTYES